MGELPAKEKDRVVCAVFFFCDARCLAGDQFAGIYVSLFEDIFAERLRGEFDEVTREKADGNRSREDDYKAACVSMCVSHGKWPYPVIDPQYIEMHHVERVTDEAEECQHG